MNDSTRMAMWLFISVLFYSAAFFLGDSPVLQTVAFKLGNVTVAGNVGYWLARTALGRIYPDSPPQDRVARAIVMGAAMVGVSLGL
jgi:hypothetical protein